MIKINSILPILLQIQQNLQQKPQKQLNVSKISNQPAIENTNKAPLASPTTNSLPTKSGEAVSARPQTAAEIFYLPLPLKSDLFKSASFFLRQYQGNESNHLNNNPKVFLKIATANLGLLWIGIESNTKQSLSVRIFTENSATRQAVNQALPGMETVLKQSGYSNINTNCRVQPDVQHCQHIDPTVTDAAVIKSLLDWVV
ncbi:MAG: flagellar hook-length control protein FliK [Desulfotomaculum sp.]|nr:flagellar hook-length control protein FliK [Desulfotomaculum sp.]MCL0080686.1 flagellar hook-length control protein FliK [Peptococcaceae bacterium]